MTFASLFRPSRQFITGAALMLLCAVMVAYAPMASVSTAQSVNNAQLQTLKDKAVSELQRRIDSYKKTMNSMDVNVQLINDNTSTNANSGNTLLTQGANGLTGGVALPDGLKDKVKQFMEKVLGGLTALIEKVKSTTSLTDMQSLAKNVDAQYGLDQLTQVTSSVTQATSSTTGVLGNLKSTFNDLQGQVSAMKECETNATSSTGASVNCSNFNLSSNGTATEAQSQLDNLSSVTTTISSVLLSVVGLLTTLISSFTSLLGGLGSGGSLGNLGNLSNMLSGSQLSSLTGSSGGVAGLMSSFTAITSQLDLANGMSGNALNGLSSLSGLINV